MKTIRALAFVVLSIGMTSVWAADYTWNGGAGSWSDDTKWTPQGVPDATHTVAVADGDITLAEAVSVKGLALSGTVTFSGADLTVSESADAAFSTAAGGTYTFNNKLILPKSSASANVNFGGNVFFNGGFAANTASGDRLRIAGGGVIRISDVPAAMKALILLAGTVHLDVADNLFTRLEVVTANTVLHVNADNAWQRDKFEYFYIYGGAKMYLHGHDVYVSPWPILGGNADGTSKNEINTDEPATFEVKHTHANTDIRTNSTVNLTGPLTFKMNADSTGTFALNRAVDSTGSLIVDGGVFDMTANASWPNMASLHLGENGKLRLAAGAMLAVPALYLNGSDTSELEGTYGATGSGATNIDDDHFEGVGVVCVRFADVPPTTRTLVRSGKLSDATCWDPVGMPHAGDTLVMTGGTLNVDFATTVEKAVFSNECVLLGEPLTVSGPAVTSLTTAPGGTYVFSNKIVYATTTTAALGLAGTIYFDGGLDYPNYFAPSLYSEIHFRNVPAKTQKVTVFNSTVYIEVPGNSFGRIQAEYSTSHVHVLVDNPWLDSPWDYMYMTGGASLYLHGHDVHVPNWALLGSTGNTVGALTSDEPATFAVSQTHAETDIRTNSMMDVTGQVTFKMDTGSTTKFVLNRPITTAAGVTVEAGTFEFTAKASATNAANIAVSGVSAAKKGRMVVNASKTFSRKAAVTLGANGILELAAGTANRVASLKIDGVDQPCGTYGASGSGAQFVDDAHFAGTGLLQVTGGGLLLIFR